MWDYARYKAKLHSKKEVEIMDWELVFWCVAGAICLVFFALCILPINWDYYEKDDPYKYCPREEE